MTRRELTYGVTAIVLAAGLLFLIAEIGLRLADRFGMVSYWDEIRAARRTSIWMRADHPDLGYRHRPDYLKDGVRHTETHGILRPDDVSPEKPPGVFRIAVIGDSVTAALDLDHAERFPTLLEQRLREEERNVEVLNFAVNGYSTEQEATLLETLAERFSPDLVVLQYCVNDLRPSEFPWSWYQPIPRSYVLAWVDYQIKKRTYIGYPPAQYWERSYREDTEGWASVRRGFRRVAVWAREHGVPVVFLLCPVLSHEGWDAGDAAARHRRVASAAREAGFEVLDLLPELRRYPVEEFRLEPWDTFHFNPAGHRLIAQLLAQRVRQVAWGGGPPDGAGEREEDGTGTGRGGGAGPGLRPR